MAPQDADETWSQRLVRLWHRPSWWNLLIVTPWVLGAALSIYWWRTDRAIAHRQQTAQGTVLTHEPHNHDRYGYSFSLNGKSYSGWQVPNDKLEPSVGQQVTVYYDPTDPSISALMNYHELSLRRLGPVPFLIGGSGFVALFILVRRRMTAMKT